MALIDKETICAEIKRLIGIHSTEVSDRVKRGVSPIDSENDTSMALIGQCHQLLGFLDSFPEQPAEGLEEEIDRFCESMWEFLPNFNYSDGHAVISVVNNAARHFYELGKNASKEE